MKGAGNITLSHGVTPRGSTSKKKKKTWHAALDGEGRSNDRPCTHPQ